MSVGLEPRETPAFAGVTGVVAEMTDVAVDVTGVVVKKTVVPARVTELEAV